MAGQSGWRSDPQQDGLRPRRLRRGYRLGRIGGHRKAGLRASRLFFGILCGWPARENAGGSSPLGLEPLEVGHSAFDSAALKTRFESVMARPFGTIEMAESDPRRGSGAPIFTLLTQIRSSSGALRGVLVSELQNAPFQEL